VVARLAPYSPALFNAATWVGPCQPRLRTQRRHAPGGSPHVVFHASAPSLRSRKFPLLESLVPSTISGGGCCMWLPRRASKGRLREAENARRNRLEIVRARSIGQISRRDLLKWGLITGSGALAWKQGLNPFVRSAYASIPTGSPPSPLFGVQPFSTAMPRFDLLPRLPVTALTDRNGNPLPPTKEANTTLQLLAPALEGVVAGDKGPIEGRPPGPIWAHQRFEQFPPKVAF